MSLIRIFTIAFLIMLAGLTALFAAVRLNPSMFATEEARSQGEFLGFTIGMSKAEAMSVVHAQYVQHDGVFFSGDSGGTTSHQVPVDTLLQLSRWYIAFGGYYDSIELRFCGDELIVVTRHKNPFGRSS